MGGAGAELCEVLNKGCESSDEVEALYAKQAGHGSSWAVLSVVEHHNSTLLLSTIIDRNLRNNMLTITSQENDKSAEPRNLDKI